MYMNKRKRKGVWIRCLAVILLCFSIFMSPVCTNASYAKPSVSLPDKGLVDDSDGGSKKSGWLDENVTGTIYGGDDGFQVNDTDEEPKEMGLVEGLFVEFVTGFADGLHYVLDKLGLSIDSVIMGRVNGGGIIFNGKRVSLVTFDTADGNIYASIAFAIFSLLRDLVCVIIAYQACH